MIDGRLNVDHHTGDCLDTRSNLLISKEQLNFIAANYDLLANETSTI